MIRVGILTISDSVCAGRREDASGPALRNHCTASKWAIAAEATVPDDREGIAGQLRAWVDGGVANVILTTGGTGVSARDITPEATRSVIDREIPGMAEQMRSRGLEQTKFSVLSRAIAGTRGGALIVNLPGSPRGAVHSLKAIEDVIPHVIDLLSGETEHDREA